ncbi:MAG: hypothetical protein IKK09_08180 [Clostridia bacterium]|nr:hypothetical protein [Clostridia bacterium]
MKEYIERKIKAEKIFRVFLIVAFLAFFGMIFILDTSNEWLFIGSYLLCMVWVISIFVYLIKYLLWTKVSRELKNYDWQETVSDISLDKPTLPKSKIYCGRKAFYSQKSKMVIPYHQIVWIYYKVQHFYGLPVSKQVIIHTRSGNRFILEADNNEFAWLLENLIVPFSPGVVIGFGSEQKKRYKEIRKAEINKK